MQKRLRSRQKNRFDIFFTWLYSSLSFWADRPLRRSQPKTLKRRWKPDRSPDCWNDRRRLSDDFRCCCCCYFRYSRVCCCCSAACRPSSAFCCLQKKVRLRRAIVNSGVGGPLEKAISAFWGLTEFGKLVCAAAAAVVVVASCWEVAADCFDWPGCCGLRLEMKHWEKRNCSKPSSFQTKSVKLKNLISNKIIRYILSTRNAMAPTCGKGASIWDRVGPKQFLRLWIISRVFKKYWENKILIL